MELSLEVRLLLFVALAAAVVLVLYIELKVLSKKRDARLEARQAREELYNLVVTTEAIADSLRNRGMEVSEAEILAKRARAAYESRDSVRARALCMQARKLFSDARFVQKQEESELPFQLSCEVPEPEQREIPTDNSLQSGFMISCVRSQLGNLFDSEREQASSILDEAEREQEAGNFDKALSLAYSARRVLDGDVPDDGVTCPEIACPSCSHELTPDDVFCSRCGERVS